MSRKKNRYLTRTALLVLTISVLLGASAEAAVNADFSFSPPNPVAGCDVVQFTDITTGNPTHWQWHFEPPFDTVDSTEQNPAWTFIDPGSYTVTLTVLIPPFDIDSITKTIVVTEPDYGDLSFTASSFAVYEDAGTAAITVQRTSGSDCEISVTCNTSDGTAVAPGDYSTSSTILSWSHGDSSTKICPIPIVDDSEFEGDETLVVSLANVTGGTNIISPNLATLTIIGDDIFADGFESGSTSAWSATAKSQVEPDAGVAMLSILSDSGCECGPVQLAPAVTTGSIRVKVLASDLLHFRLSQAGAVVLDRQAAVDDGEGIRISGLELGSYELEISDEQQQRIRFSIQLTAAVPCAELNLDY